MMRYYKGTFDKASGEQRTMYFVRPNDLPNSFINEKLKNTKVAFRKRNLKEGFETVWDLQKQEWRTFNWNSSKEGVETFDGSEELLNNFNVLND